MATKLYKTGSKARLNQEMKLTDFKANGLNFNYDKRSGKGTLILKSEGLSDTLKDAVFYINSCLKGSGWFARPEGSPESTATHTYQVQRISFYQN